MPRLLVDCVSIVAIDLLLAGDNALVIAMAVRALPPRQRRVATACGAAGAVLLRVILTCVAARLLAIEFIKLLGGLLVVWIAVKVLADASSAAPGQAAPRRFLRAIWFIVFADLTMSTDNILAVAGASRGHMGLIVFGLCLSIPLVVLSSNLLAVLMDRYPLTVYLGAAILGKVGGEMMVTDPLVARVLQPSPAVCYTVEALLVLGIVVAGKLVSDALRRAKPAVVEARRHAAKAGP